MAGTVSCIGEPGNESAERDLQNQRTVTNMAHKIRTNNALRFAIQFSDSDRLLTRKYLLLLLYLRLDIGFETTGSTVQIP